MNFPLYFVLVESNGEYYLLAKSTNNILAFRSEDIAIKSIESSYKNSMDRRAVEAIKEGTTSACLHYIFIHPQIIRINTYKELCKLFEDPNKVIYMNINYCFGGFCGACIKGDIARSLFNKGIKPLLITED
jgi:hypothetical protein